ncbi:MAG: PIG-L family deacetylase [Verrucomicrobia bacterium]|nr:PIG-L family deacetylase [Verrucomicrobiota bacterium]
MNPYLKFVENIQANVESAKGLVAEGKTAPVESDKKVLLFSPHPDDECITGLLPLRLMREAGMQIINVPVTFGSNVERQPGRAAELQDACDYLGWGIQQRNGFQNLEKQDLVEILKAVQPKALFFPHSKDWNSRHIATHFLVMEALAEMPSDFSCTVIEAEFWGAMDDPNLMVEADAQTLADLVAATSLHVEEVARNPYHLLLPAWMQDNVRRGGELVGGQGGAVPDFAFATLYRLSKWQDGELFRTLETGRMLAMDDNLTEII